MISLLKLCRSLLIAHSFKSGVPKQSAVCVWNRMCKRGHRLCCRMLWVSWLDRSGLCKFSPAMSGPVYHDLSLEALNIFLLIVKHYTYIQQCCDCNSCLGKTAKYIKSTVVFMSGHKLALWLLFFNKMCMPVINLKAIVNVEHWLNTSIACMSEHLFSGKWCFLMKKLVEHLR